MPDEDGAFINNNIGLGMRRLSIIDLDTGSQPIFNEDKTLVIVFNGEIYNYKSLKKDLLNKGHTFYTDSDTEVVLHCYEEYKENSFNKLNGMFVFSIYNLKSDRLIIARDRAGEKPLYYHKNNDFFIFASELKSILSTNLLKKEINIQALNQYFRLTYIPAPLTIFNNVYKLKPGHYIEINKNEEIEQKQYWNVQYNEESLIRDYNDCKNKLRETMFKAVEEAMVADVPIGTFLSGGIDSTIITGIASQLSNKKIDTFTIGFRDKQFDESGRAKIAAEFHDTNHHIKYLEHQDILKHLDKILKNIDEPFADPSYLPTYMVSNFASGHVKTVLTGDSGDELFGGYDKYLINYYSNLYNKVPKWLRENIIEKIIYKLPDTTSFTRKIRKVINNSNKNVFDQRKSLMCLGFGNEEIKQLFQKQYIQEDSLDFIEDYYDEVDMKNELHKTLYTDLKVVLEGDMLHKVDRTSMLNSLETRVPMLHKDVIELSAQIPAKYKINTKNKKIILKDTFSDLIPDKLFNAKKHGFRVPIDKWFKNELKSNLLNELNEEQIRSEKLFNYDYIENILNDHFTNKVNRSRELWSLFVFEKWLHEYL
ncbi:asparagine synthase (glutamine-hydrolyzing) [Halanaerobium sp.]|jgi:asparagine synthase (glutamine-hydrolysing)|uniref:asparagine synthase (glutamine-hydrolyzing) n=1 Tax=Halanaerobium sp. TaxID=1895664 RepID=UPI000DE74B4D|nr:asparagine synthase (glutamine-hydrolyzing) [Halanaerobium sp.]PUU91028.1 MAG: asparagine synthase (glutamine-hydrolysing) [Halanaerobium sp.]